MNKADLINSISKKTGLTKTKSSEVIDILTSTISESLSNGEKVTLVGFGTFTTSERSERIGRNPLTGESVKVPRKRVAKFKPGTNLSRNLL